MFCRACCVWGFIIIFLRWYFITVCWALTGKKTKIKNQQYLITRSKWHRSLNISRVISNHQRCGSRCFAFGAELYLAVPLCHVFIISQLETVGRDNTQISTISLQAMANTCLLVCITNGAAVSRGMLCLCHTEPSAWAVRVILSAMAFKWWRNRAPVAQISKLPQLCFRALAHAKQYNLSFSVVKQQVWIHCNVKMHLSVFQFLKRFTLWSYLMISFNWYWFHLLSLTIIRKAIGHFSLLVFTKLNVQL